MNLALFDFDGTITSRETFPLFMRFAVSKPRLVAGSIAFAPIVAGYRAGLVSGSTIRSALIRFGFRGVLAARVEEAGRRFARDVLPGLIRPNAMARLRWHREQGDAIVVVSGALDVYLAPWCAQQGLDLFCSQLDDVEGVLNGRYRGRQCVVAEKVRRVREKYDLSGYSTVYAYGDTEEDRDLLAVADKKFFRWQELR